VQRQAQGNGQSDATDTLAYDGYGARLGDIDSTTGMPEAYSDPAGFGGQWGDYGDAETGLQLLTHRYYDSGAGRFLSRDPSGYGGGLNLYGFADDNPINEADPSGLQGFDMQHQMDNAASGAQHDDDKDPAAYRASWNQQMTTERKKQKKDVEIYGNAALMFVPIPGEGFIAEAAGRGLTKAGGWAVRGAFVSRAVKGTEIVANLTNAEARGLYLSRVARIPDVEKSLAARGVSLRQRALAAYTIRHLARLESRARMANRAALARLEIRDIEKYGHFDGPKFEELLQQAQREGKSIEDAYQEIIGSSTRTDQVTNSNLGL
jgi:RHS repeat-associated protein